MRTDGKDLRKEECLTLNYVGRFPMCISNKYRSYPGQNFVVYCIVLARTAIGTILIRNCKDFDAVLLLMRWRNVHYVGCSW